jgi:CheY-like chemotaxis protein
MSRQREPVLVLMAEDDEDDRLMAREAWEDARIVNELRFVHDGEQLMDYLMHRGGYSNPATAPRPGLILLDLNMPRKDGREALEQIKANPRLQGIPVIVMTTSKAEEDICRSYDLGASSYISKPLTYDGLVGVMKGLGRYWFEIVDLPAAGDGGSGDRQRDQDSAGG